MHTLTLDAADADAIAVLLDELADRYADVEDQAFQDELTVQSHRLPLALRRFLTDFRLHEPAGACVVSGYRVDQDRIGATPTHWRHREGISPALREEMFVLLCGALLGEPVAWATQQDGYLVHDVLPVKGHEDEQIGTGSNQTIFWHVEDAFHPYRGDYVGLLCLRNPDRVPTTFVGAQDLEISAEDRRILAEPRFYMLPDNSHLQMLDSGPGRPLAGGTRLLDAAYERLKRMLEDAAPVPVLFGSPGDPYLCLDPYFMDLDRLDPEARSALQRLSDEIDRRLGGAALAPGEIVFVDNYRAVHGRSSFAARFDGTDRWLKRVNVARDLRKSRDARATAGSRVLF
ncbi:guanitoxin biosynthesis L-enduracididine beta-hydroxylase GntD [Streptomyces sp. NBC_00083]|uniref:guanitoxin biosynthesis L-enduracididine beta-hydroxylase GntD n=1 Tax=Streptomyces sp. NBC_00083 TaxID=2975647 RepID=UPI00224D9052|nr:guanitoxin biosynthesis L-enduracididine beta-hydroxylase GntD [Streptomyces sp. NBC_00083]MCX5387043.1 TauD/TfdA family dioxygenase [Streptomyces sp. NBC_00083]